MSSSVPGRDALVSVIVCNHNHGRYLGRAIDSVAAQGHPAVELWLVDDGSTDVSRKVMTDAARRHGSRFAAVDAVLRDRNQGKLACTNAVLPRLRGELVLFFDADDVLAPSFLEESIEALRAHRRREPAVAFVYTDSELIDWSGRALGSGRALPWDRGLLARSSYIPGCAVTLTAAVRAAAPYDESIRIGTKHHMWRRLCDAGWEGRHLARPLFQYRLHAGNTSGIGARLLPELSADRPAEHVLAPYWPTAAASDAM